MLPTFPSRYWFTIGLRQSLALRDGPRRFGQDSTCPALLRCHLQSIAVTRTGLSPSTAALSKTFWFLDESSLMVLQPRHVRKRIGLGSAPFARHYSGYRLFFLFLRVLRCFSSPGSPHLYDGTGSSIQWVAPFGYGRINSCLPIPGYFRSLPRPSSPAEAKASSIRPCFSFLVNQLSCEIVST